MRTPTPRAIAMLTGSALMLLGCVATIGTADAVARTTTEYEVIFEATWSAETHPLDFPPNPHFSGLIGGTHHDQIDFWEVGELASPGIENMAETGSKSPLEDEVQAAIDAGTAGVIISGGGIGTSPGFVSDSFTIDEIYPLVTVVSMLAPSPDWFVGVDGVNLWENGNWLDSKVVELVVFDAGTDSGPSYQSPNQPTVPAVPLFEKLDGPFAAGNIVGTFTFIRATVGVPGVMAGRQTFLVPLGPNPLRESSRFEIQVPAGMVGELRVYDVIGRQVRDLLREPIGTGRRVVIWDGRNDRGARVPRGAYFLRLNAGPMTRTEKIIVR